MVPLGLPGDLPRGRPGGSNSKECLQHGRPGFDPWIGKIPWRRAWQPTPVPLPGKTHWTEKLGRLQFMGSQGVRHNLVTKEQQQRRTNLVVDDLSLFSVGAVCTAADILTSLLGET